MTKDKIDELLYAERDTEALGQIYVDHVQAMTAEGLHSKSDIAAELAYRDQALQSLQGELDEAREVMKDIRDNYSDDIDANKYNTRYCPYVAQAFLKKMEKKTDADPN